MMLPQRPYFPVGSLHAAIVYPAEVDAFSAERVRDALVSVGLPQLAPRLQEDAHWNRTLSLGEQQRLGVARALLHAPQYLFLDEATASLDEPSEMALYRLLREKLPATTMVSIGHRSTLEAFHQRNVVVVGDGNGFALREADEKARPSGLTLQPAARPRPAPDPAMPDQGEQGQQHRAQQHRRETGMTRAGCWKPPAAD